MSDPISELRSRAERELAAVKTSADLDAWQARYLSRKGEAKVLLKDVGKVGDPEERRRLGRAVNEVNSALEEGLGRRRAEIAAAESERKLAAERVDVSMSGTGVTRGRIHPVHRTLREICEIFHGMGFQIFESPHVETDEYNFQYLNFPRHHPARDMQDTFFVSEDVVLRTHTSPGQIHAMRACAPEPLRALLPGACYRNEAITPRSEIQFHQVEGLAIGAGVGLADLKGVLDEFARLFFGGERRVTFRGSYFPFTEPSVEVDVECILCDGKGCRLCKGSGWLEILGAGVVHPVVLEHGGYDPRQFSGFAFGMGVERLVMLRHAIDDIRHFCASDLRFLEQFP